jgi:branched-chain amino acid transport system substrate-binding protein
MSQAQNPRQKHIILFFLLTSCIVAIFGCSPENQDPIKIGFIGTLTGHTAVVGDACRDAVMLAAEQVNQKGGIDGRKVELIIKDIQQNESLVDEAIVEFNRQKVPVVIGPMFSSMAVAAANASKEGETIFVSPTASTTMINNRDDNFFRLYPPSNIAAQKMANHVIDKSIKRISIIVDNNNRAFTEDWKNYFVEQYTARGGNVVDTIHYLHENISYNNIIDNVVKNRPSALLILSNAFETAMFCQQLKKLAADIPVFASEWSMTNGLIEAGGKSVEGIEFFHILDSSSNDELYLDFLEAYRERYKIAPSYPATLAYDAALVVFKGLESGAASGPALKESLLKLETIRTLQTSIVFDKYGEVNRTLFLNTVKEGKIVSVSN